jgi:hypothetical protein
MVMRRSAAWLVAVSSMIGGTLAAHSLAYRLVYPQAEVRLRILSATGHGYMGYAPLLFGVLAALMVVGFGAAVMDAARRRGPRPVPAWAFALLPLLGFTTQEFLERWLTGSNFPWWMVMQPTFRVGLALQLPFALLAYRLARLLLRAAREVGAVFVGRPLPVALFSPAPAARLAAVCLPRFSSLSLGWSERGPPLLSV